MVLAYLIQFPSDIIQYALVKMAVDGTVINLQHTVYLDR